MTDLDKKYPSHDAYCQTERNLGHCAYAAPLARAEEENTRLTEHAAYWERHFKLASQKCLHRQGGLCWIDCPNREVCKTEGLIPFQILPEPGD